MREAFSTTSINVNALLNYYHRYFSYHEEEFAQPIATLSNTFKKPIDDSLVRAAQHFIEPWKNEVRLP